MSVKGPMGNLSTGAVQSVPRPGAKDVYVAQGEGTRGELGTLGSRLLIHLFIEHLLAPGTGLGTVKREEQGFCLHGVYLLVGRYRQNTSKQVC